MSVLVYRFGLLLAVFGGFLALNSTGLASGVGIGSLFVGTLVGIVGLLQASLAGSDRGGIRDGPG